MRVNRVLWVEDKVDELLDKSKEIQDSFLPYMKELTVVRTLQEALEEIERTRLFAYDTIVLDINFENNLGDKKNVIEKLEKHIFLDEKLRDDIEELEKKGGYLLFVYLISRGYPSDRICFLSGNGPVIDIWKKNNTQHELDILNLGIKEVEHAWQMAQGVYDEYESLISMELKNVLGDENLSDCFDSLEEGSTEYKNIFKTAKETLLKGVNRDINENQVGDVGDDMIKCFRNANLRVPVFFAKDNYGMRGHKISDAKEWLETLRTKKTVVRWLMMWISSYIEEKYILQEKKMHDQEKVIFVSKVPIIRASFKQMYINFSDYFNPEKEGALYYALLAILLPFEQNIKRDSKESAPEDTKNRRIFAQFAKAARNFLCHNYIVKSASEESILFILMGTLLAVLSFDQQEEMASWYEESVRVFELKSPVSRKDLLAKIDDIIMYLYQNAHLKESFDQNGNAITEVMAKEKPSELLTALGRHAKMIPSKTHISPSQREEYYVFILAAYIIKSFDATEGKYIKLMYDVAAKIVENYEYPK